ncbi:tyrosine-protein phosphatase [Pseudonocardia sp. CA-107938]|uniref:tyrosine-protein phosphatase n=1 Tax=Pseudonocardia sp. CA-107938 TaxID=3240021 RepID=UPI003D8F3236
MIDDRLLPLDGVDNARDVGGLPLRGGGRTRYGVLLRTANPSHEHLTPADLAYLVEEYGLRLVLDLRRPDEIELNGRFVHDGVDRAELTLIGESREALPEGVKLSYLEIYRGYLTDHPGNVVEAVRLLAAVDAGPALVHCAAGKDRTGTVVALVLDAVGVERDAVIADYALSAMHVEAMFRRWTTAAGTPMPDPDALDRHRPQAQTMADLLAELDETHGGAAGWLLANGLTEAELQRLRERFREPEG